MKRRIFTAFLALVLIFTMAIPALAASSYFKEGTYDDVAYQLSASCSSIYAHASTCYGDTSRTVSTTVSVDFTNGESLSYSTGVKTIEARIAIDAGSRTIDTAECVFVVTGAINRTATLTPA